MDYLEIMIIELDKVQMELDMLQQDDKRLCEAKADQIEYQKF